MLVEIAKFFTDELPSLLDLTAKAMRKAPWPRTISEMSQMNRDECLQLAPSVLGFVVALSWTIRVTTSTNSSIKTYRIARMILLKGMGLIYFFAFLTSAFQGRAIFGTDGVAPMQRSSRPTFIFDLLETYVYDPNLVLELISWIGVVLSLFMVFIPTIQRPCWCVLPFSLWILYLSLVNLGSLIINYGWEWETCEVGFLIIFLCPLLPFLKHVPEPSPIVIGLLRFGIFRIMFGAGMSKLGRNSSPCWRELTCTETHYTTQPMPNPLSYYAHMFPPSLHRIEVALTFFEQVILPWFVMMPTGIMTTFAGVCEIMFQSLIVGTGNYAWINYISTLPCISLFDDETLTSWFGFSRTLLSSSSSSSSPSIYRKFRFAVHILLACFLIERSVEPLKELFGPAPWLHFYDDYFFVNAHGVFGFINDHRVSLVMEYTHDDVSELSCQDSSGVVAHDKTGRGYACKDLISHCGSNQGISRSCPLSCGMCEISRAQDVKWKALDFKNLPGTLTKRPLVNSPYHYRFDWQVWIETTARMDRFVNLNQVRSIENARSDIDDDFEIMTDLEKSQQSVAVPHIVRRTVDGILNGDTDSIGLMAPSVHDLIVDSKPPSAIRYRYFLYRFATDDIWSSSWWTRVPVSKPFVIIRDQENTNYKSRRDPYDERQNALLASAISVVYSFFMFKKSFALYFIVIGLFLIFADYMNDSSAQCSSDVLSYNTVWFASAFSVAYLISELLVTRSRKRNRLKHVIVLLLLSCVCVVYSGRGASMCRMFSTEKLTS